MQILLQNCFVWNFKNLLTKKIWFLTKFIIPMRQVCIGNVFQQKHLLHRKKSQLQATNCWKSALPSCTAEMLQVTIKMKTPNNWKGYETLLVGYRKKKSLVVYFNQKGTQMTRDIFLQWLWTFLFLKAGNTCKRLTPKS